jgi:hypothetical protein
MAIFNTDGSSWKRNEWQAHCRRAADKVHQCERSFNQETARVDTDSKQNDSHLGSSTGIIGPFVSAHPFRIATVPLRKSIQHWQQLRTEPEGNQRAPVRQLVR